LDYIFKPDFKEFEKDMQSGVIQPGGIPASLMSEIRHGYFP
jgi:hypothetical protein